MLVGNFLQIQAGFFFVGQVPLPVDGFRSVFLDHVQQGHLRFQLFSQIGHNRQCRFGKLGTVQWKEYVFEHYLPPLIVVKMR